MSTAHRSRHGKAEYANAPEWLAKILKSGRSGGYWLRWESLRLALAVRGVSPADVQPTFDERGTLRVVAARGRSGARSVAVRRENTVDARQAAVRALWSLVGELDKRGD